MRLESKGKAPPARSGHRMTYFKVRKSREYTRIFKACVDRLFRTTSSYLADFKILHRQRNTYRIFGYMTVRSSLGMALLYLLPVRSLMPALPSLSFLTYVCRFLDIRTFLLRKRRGFTLRLPPAEAYPATQRLHGGRIADAKQTQGCRSCHLRRLLAIEVNGGRSEAE